MAVKMGKRDRLREFARKFGGSSTTTDSAHQASHSSCSNSNAYIEASVSSIAREDHLTPSALLEASQLKKYIAGTIIMCKNPDVIIKLHTESGELVEFHIASQLLSTASPVFARILDPNSPMPSLINPAVLDISQGEEKENIPEEDSTKNLPYINLYEDDDFALWILLSIIHYSSDEVPNILTYADYIKLAVTIDKYDCAEAVNPWGGIWGRSLEMYALQPGNENWLFAATVFNHPGQFEDLTKALIYEAVPFDSEYILRNGQRVQRDVFPERILGKFIYLSLILSSFSFTVNFISFPSISALFGKYFSSLYLTYCT